MKKYKILLEENACYEEMNFSLELAQLIGLFSSKIDFPIIESRPRPDFVYLKPDLSSGIEKTLYGYKIGINDDNIIEKVLDQVFSSEKTHSQAIKEDGKDDLRISDIFEQGSFKERDRNGFYNYKNLSICPQETYNDSLIGASLVARISMDQRTISYPIVHENGLIDIGRSNSNRIFYDEPRDKIICNYKDDDFYNILKINDLDHINKYMEDTLACKNIDGQIAAASLDNKASYYTDPIQDNRKLDYIEKKAMDIRSYQEDLVYYEDEKTFPWELDLFYYAFKSNLYKLPKENIKIQGAVSENKEVRQGLMSRMRSVLDSEGIEADIEIVDSYKQGFSYTRDFIIPALDDSVEDILIKFSPFTDGSYEEEDGSLPSYDISSGSMKGKYLDLPIRLLQELYPIDDIIEIEAGIPRDKISFQMDQSIEGYEIIVRSANNEERYSFRPGFSQRNYLDDFDDLGLVHPGTSYIRFFSGQDLVFEENIGTDLERIWDYYQKVILPKAASLYEGNEPIFSKLVMEVDLSETDEKLPIRQDLLSSADSFHEDMYFTGLDYFKALGREKIGQPIEAPGLILPIFNIKESSPKISWKITRNRADKALKRINNREEYLETNPDIYLKEISYEDSRLIGHYESSEDLSGLVDLIEYGASDIPMVFDGLVVNGRACKLPKIEKNLSMDNYQPLDTLYGYGEYISDIEKLKQIEGIRVRQIATSYEGRPIHAISYENEDFSTSMKNSQIRPSIYINARHHANEISSTNSTFELIKKYCKSDIRDKVNLVFVPMENPDGSAIHYELQKDHPEWIFHIARFDAKGKEFSLDYFTGQDEAQGLENVYYEFLPDIYIDDHGVPSHEWSQQFSGYTSPAYKGFWLPRSLMYGYFWYAKGYEANNDLAKELQDKVSEAIGSVEDFKDLNQDLRNRHHKYANAWMEKLFPADYYKDLIFYWIGFEEDHDHRYLSIRFPQVVKVAFTSEVADETASGEYLKDCIRAHIVHNEAIIDHMANKEYEFSSSYYINGGQIIIKNERCRI